jgi:hypothetical protein
MRAPARSAMPIALFLVRDSTVLVDILRAVMVQEVMVQEVMVQEDTLRQVMAQMVMDQEVIAQALMVQRANRAAMVQTLPGRLK